MLGAARAMASASAICASPNRVPSGNAVMQPFCAPWVRSWRVSLRGVDVGNRHRAFALQVLGQRQPGAEVRDPQRKILDHQAGGKDLAPFDILLVDPDVADVRIRQCDDLLAVARVGKDFLVAGERSVEHHLTDCAARRADRGASKHRPVGKSKDGGRQIGQQSSDSGVFRTRRLVKKPAIVAAGAGAPGAAKPPNTSCPTRRMVIPDRITRELEFVRRVASRNPFHRWRLVTNE